jgi:hypothetical protein
MWTLQEYCKEYKIKFKSNDQKKRRGRFKRSLDALQRIDALSHWQTNLAALARKLLHYPS